MKLKVPCGYGCEAHFFPLGWTFGGANGSDPRTDSRWRPTTYTYYNERAESIHVTQTPLCDEQAIDEFTLVSSYGNSFIPVYVAALRPDGKVEMLKVRYDKVSDTAYDT
jgi:hypothetical protein